MAFQQVIKLSINGLPPKSIEIRWLFDILLKEETIFRWGNLQLVMTTLKAMLLDQTNLILDYPWSCMSNNTMNQHSICTDAHFFSQSIVS